MAYPISVGYAVWRIITRNRQQVLQTSAVQCHSSSICSYGPVTSRMQTRSKSSSVVLSKKLQRKGMCTTKRNPFDYDEMRQRLGGMRVRNFARSSRCNSIAEAEPTFELTKEQMKKEEWLPVYRFHGIRFYTLLSKMKFLQTAFSIFLIPYGYHGVLNETVTSSSYSAMCALAVFAPTMLWFFNRSFSRVVGVVSMNQNRTAIRVGHVSFWGGRQDTGIELEDIVPLTECPDDLTKGLVRLGRYSKNMEIVNKELSELIFGTNAYFVEIPSPTKAPIPTAASSNAPGKEKSE